MLRIAEPQPTGAPCIALMNSILLIDKPAGITSHDVVSRVRRIIKEKSVGHLGTLDPMATGVLPLLTGKFTRIAQFFSLAEKEYEGTIRFGFATDTLDGDGVQVTDELPLELTLEELNEKAVQLRGAIRQVPPAYSAKKVAGVPAYKMARRGDAAVLDAVEVTVHQFAMISLEQSCLRFTSVVSSGTYIRSLAHELGKLAGCGAHLASLRRTRVGEFHISSAIPLEQLELEFAQNATVGLHPRTILPAMPSVGADATAMSKIRHGNAVNLPEFSSAKFVKVFHNNSELVAIASRVAGTLFQPKIVLV
ncbi:MAG: tRNA pseudouridine(55) synthase TruB [Acidobacteriaceae bacterium]